MQSIQRPLICFANLCCCLLAIVVVAALGCSPAAPTVAILADENKDAQANSADQTAIGQLAGDDYWDAFYMQGSKVGYGHTTIAPAEKGKPELLRIEALNKLSVMRFGERSDQELRTVSFETPTGQVERWELHSALGTQPVVVTGVVKGDQMHIHSSDGSPDQQIAWSGDFRGFGGVEQSLTTKPMQPGEQRTLKLLMPMLNQVVTAEMKAGKLEEVKMLVGSQKLLRVDSVLRLPGGNDLASVLWVDARGRALKTRMDAMQQETFRTTADVAQAVSDGKGFDLGADAIVAIDPPLANPHGIRKIVYEVEIVDGEPADVFAAGATQQIKPLGPHKAQLTVEAIRPNDAQNAGKQSPAAGSAKKLPAEFTAPNSIVQSDDPLVVKMAGSVAQGETDPWRVAVALEKLVNETITKKNFSQALGTASQVAASHEGDCTEHAVLLAALARARDIPARVAIGLVYVAGLKGFGFHMWTEVYIAGRWVPLDATLGQGGIGAAHLQLTSSSLQGASTFSSFLPVAQVLGRLKIKVVSVE